MGQRYKVILSNKAFYREVSLPIDEPFVCVGTTRNCSVRLGKGLFFDDIELRFDNRNGQWSVACSDNLYILSDGIIKLSVKELTYGDGIKVKYVDSSQDALKIDFLMDFDYEMKDYNCMIDVTGVDQIRIGGSASCEIYLEDELVGKEIVRLFYQQGQYYISDNDSKYGVYVNGIKIQGTVPIKNYDFFSIAGFSFYYKQRKLYTAKSSKIKIQGLQFMEAEPPKSKMQYPKFNRNTRIQYEIPEEEIEVLAPEAEQKMQKKSILLSLIPSLVMLGMTIVLRGVLGNGGTFVIYSACTMTMGIIMSIITYVGDRKQFKKDSIQRKKLYNEYIERKEKEIQESRENELAIRRKISTSPEENINEVLGFGKRIFEKEIKDKDFLEVYLGTGQVEAKCKVEYAHKETISVDDPLMLVPEEIEEKYHYIQDAPIIVPFKEASGVGVVGTRTKLLEYLKNISLDIASRHFYKDVKMVYFMEYEDVINNSWICSLPHVTNEKLNVRNVICDEESQNVLLEYYYSVLATRESESNEETPTAWSEHYVFFVMDARKLAVHPISKYFSKADKYGFTFVFLEEYEEFIPQGCTEMIYLENKEDGATLKTENGEIITDFKYPDISNGVMESVSTKLSAVYVDEVNLASELTKSITMFELLGIVDVTDLDLKERWEKSEVYKTMAAPLGVKKKGEVVYLNLSDKANGHGPHGLVAGTTGSGKSEILQSYILSMATLFHPYDVSFVIIDFKGGGMANQFLNLPHLNGAVTNIDGREINRFLLSVKSELIRRQELFSQSGVNHINDYIKLYKKGLVGVPMPHLIIVVDEFAELKAEYPEFMKEIISAARIGRTLGIHLILATQKPSGVVDNQVWSNSKFRLCLKVQNKEDSNEVIKSPLAAEIVEPGRAYLQVGNNEIFDLFQSAFSGAPVPDLSATEVREYVLYSMNPWGKRTVVYENKAKKTKENVKNQLETIIDYIAEYVKSENYVPLPGICLPSLPDTLTLDEITVKEHKDAMIWAKIGRFDDPGMQMQEAYEVNLSESNTYIIGSAQTGKTSLLQTVICDVIQHYTPDDVNMYIFDGGNMALNCFEASNHVGGYTEPQNAERVVNLFKMLFSIIQERKMEFASKGLGTFSAYKEAGFAMPQVLVIMDNVSAFKENFSNLEEQFLKLTREGLSVGINFIVTGTQTNSIGHKNLANFGTKIALNCNDKGEYSNLFGRCKLDIKEVPGRGIVVREKRTLECQMALCVKAEREIERNKKLLEIISECNARNEEMNARQIPEVPDIVLQSELYRKNRDLYKKPYVLPIGINYSTVEYEFLSLREAGCFAVLGKAKMGKTNFAKQLLWGMEKTADIAPTEVYAFDGMERGLSFVKNSSLVKNYTMDISEMEVILEELHETLNHRLELLYEAENAEEYLSKVPLICIMMENKDLMAKIVSNKDKELTARFLDFLKKFKQVKAFVLFSNMDNVATGFSPGDVIKAIKENRKAIFLDDISEIKFLDVNNKALKEFNKPVAPGDGFLYMGNTFGKVKTIFND
ncbi:MAG: type VII secretion protein EssC [Lachnospiraceae bacterium]|nr:type VII secretion protein EssC [Lachnospiraceae bacterium]MBP3506776.1 type VII secretion protein EssC [Lachnospiraceae bacterium]